MSGYLIAEEGPLVGMMIGFEQGTEWILGRDPDEAAVILEDPMVSRKHVICRLTPEGYVLENLSSVNPATQNGKVIVEPVLLREGDIVQIGSTFFRFTEVSPAAFTSKEENQEGISPEEFSKDELSDLSNVSFQPTQGSRWLLKVISGPNAGAEFSLEKSSTYLLGKDPNLCDVVFQDLSVSRQHARITVDDFEHVFIEDLGSRNGVLVNGEMITERREITSQDLIALGTTTFLLIDQEQIHETIFSPPTSIYAKPEAPSEEASIGSMGEATLPAIKRDWREMVIPKRHLIVACVFAAFVLAVVFGMLSLFESEPISVHPKNEKEIVQDALAGYSDIQFSFNEANGKLFLVGHVLTGVDKQELIYLLKGLPFIQSIDDNVVVDELVWQNMNALLMTNSDWQGITIHAPVAGKFVMRGYLQNLAQAQALADYINVNFPYLDRLDNQVVVESNLSTQIEGQLVERGFGSVTFQLSNGELVLAGRLDGHHSEEFQKLVNQFKSLQGIRVVKNFVVLTTQDTSRVDLSSQYQVSGFSKGDDTILYVVVNGKILSLGDILDGMLITGLQPNQILLEKDGLKFKINYNLQ